MALRIDWTQHASKRASQRSIVRHVPYCKLRQEAKHLAAGETFKVISGGTTFVCMRRPASVKIITVYKAKRRQ